VGTPNSHSMEIVAHFHVPCSGSSDILHNYIGPFVHTNTQINPIQYNCSGHAKEQHHGVLLAKNGWLWGGAGVALGWSGWVGWWWCVDVVIKIKINYAFYALHLNCFCCLLLSFPFWVRLLWPRCSCCCLCIWFYWCFCCAGLMWH